MLKIYESIPATATVDANRNNFMASNDIVARVKGLKVSAGNADGLVFDHCQLYKNKHGRLVLINSLYAPNVEDLHQMGFEETAPLYTEEAQTFVKEFGTRAEANACVRKTHLPTFVSWRACGQKAARACGKYAPRCNAVADVSPQ